eukprot:CAMPEP_0178720244 /NCGR_PEP_ID=MMETSP0699-20121125/23609_1 /TAXON_ID=265572 /ORGANISM="Extubocellulus spinifer, Strain CCMP396" /LENGTH=688 /DNA_ID=CAMNT_0020370643 /DNA_START=1772 /DNA_END=3838 /DNA_ORIENTATION=-
MDPQHPVTHLLTYLSSWIKLFQESKLNTIWVFDGISPPAKERTDQRRKADRQKHIDKLEEYYKRGYAQHFEEVDKLWRKVVYPRGDIIYLVVRLLKGRGIPYMQAPFEAEAQCVRLQMDGIVEYVLSDDGDCFAYCVKLWITLAKLSGKCCVMNSNDILTRECAGGGRWNNDLAVIPPLRGCDYCPKLYRLPFASTMDAYVRSNDKDKFLDDLARNNLYPPKAAGEDNALQPAIGWENDAKVARSMFEAHPVFTIQPNSDDEKIDPNKFNEIDPSQLKLVPIIDNEALSLNPALWGQNINLGMSPQDFIASGTNERRGIPPAELFALFRLNKWARSGKDLADQNILHPKYNNQYAIMYGALPNFGHIPVELQSDEALIEYLSAHRSLPPSNRRSRPRLIEEAKRLKERKERNGARAPIPRDLASYRSRRNGTFEESTFLGALRGSDDGGALSWSNDRVVERMRGVMEITQHSIDHEIFGPGRNGIRERAALRLESSVIGEDILNNPIHLQTNALRLGFKGSLHVRDAPAFQKTNNKIYDIAARIDNFSPKLVHLLKVLSVAALVVLLELVDMFLPVRFSTLIGALFGRGGNAIKNPDGIELGLLEQLYPTRKIGQKMRYRMLRVHVELTGGFSTDKTTEDQNMSVDGDPDPSGSWERLSAGRLFSRSHSGRSITSPNTFLMVMMVVVE